MKVTTNEVKKPEPAVADEYKIPRIKKVHFNNPATVVIWADGSKTVVRCGKNDIYDPEKGLAMAIVKKVFGNNYHYYDRLAKHLKHAPAND